MAYLDSSNVEDLVADIKELADQTYASTEEIADLKSEISAKDVALNNLIKKMAFSDALNYEYIDFLVAYGFNLFDPENANILNMYIDTGAMKIAAGNGTDRSAYIRIKPSTKYKIVKNVSAIFRVGTTVTEPALNVSVTNTQANHSGTELEITSGASDNWLFITFFNTYTSASYNYNTVLNSIKVSEQ